MVSAVLSFDSCEELRWGDPEAAGEFDDHVERGIASPALDAADVGAVEPGVVGEGFLRGPTALMAQVA